MLDRSDSTDRPARRSALIAQELSRYGIDIAALSETRLAEEGSLTESEGGYTFFWKGLLSNEPRIHGVGFAIKTSLALQLEDSPIGVSERLMKMRLPLTDGRQATILSCYAPTLQATDEDKDSFYDLIDAEVQRAPPSDKLILLGDFNARVGMDHAAWEGVIGRHGLGKMNNNGLRLLSFCSQNQLIVSNTIFDIKDIHKGSWMHPRSKVYHMLDYVLVRKRDRQDVRITRVMRGAECWSDHLMVRSVLSLRIRPPARRQPAKKKLNCTGLADAENRAQLAAAVEERLLQNDNLQENPVNWVEVSWDRISRSLMTAAEQVLGHTKRKNADWFDENIGYIRELLESKYRAHAAYKNNPSSARMKDKWKEKRSTCQRELRALENQWWVKKSQEIQRYADAGDQQNFHSALREVYGPTDRSFAPVRTADGTTLLVRKNDILQRWQQHYSTLLNTNNPSNPEELEALPHMPEVESMDDPPTFSETLEAINSLRNKKSPGTDGIPGEVLKSGGAALHHELHQLILSIWVAEEVPQQWKNARIISIYKRKGDRATCGNSRGISLLSVAGKVLAKLLLGRLNKNIVDRVCPESQCGFRRERGTVDMVFVARQLQEKCREQNRNMCMAFIDLTKAFDTVDRDLLWRVMRRFGCPRKFVAIVRAFHTNMEASVVVGGDETEHFAVQVGVKQGCVMAPVIFNLYVAAATMLFRQRTSPELGIGLTYRLDGSLFNLRRLQCPRKTSEGIITELQYADDCMLVAHSPDELQEALESLSGVYRDLGLAVNTNKTEIMFQWSGERPLVDPIMKIGQAELNTVTQFSYLGSILAADCTADAEINQRINKASASFAQIKKRVITNHNLHIATKVAVYRAICLSVLLYASETFTLYRRHIKLLESFHMRCLKKILKLTWQDRVSYVDILQRTGMVSAECLLLRNGLRWAGHVLRMPDSRLPKQVFYGQLTEGNRNIGRPKLRFKDHVKQAMKKFNLNPMHLESTAANRSQWRQAVHNGASHFESERTRARTERSRRRHAAPLPTPGGPDPNLVCPECGRVCGSLVGLRSHRRAHEREAARRHRVIVGNDGQP